MAKVTSLIVKCVSCAIAILFLTLKCVNVRFEKIDMGEVCKTVAFCAGMFIDISINTALDKFKKKKKEETE